MSQTVIRYFLLALFCFSLGIQSNIAWSDAIQSKSTKISSVDHGAVILLQNKENTSVTVDKNTGDSEVNSLTYLPAHAIQDLNFISVGFYSVQFYGIIKSAFFSGVDIASLYYAFW